MKKFIELVVKLDEKLYIAVKIDTIQIPVKAIKKVEKAKKSYDELFKLKKEVEQYERFRKTANYLGENMVFPLIVKWCLKQRNEKKMIRKSKVMMGGGYDLIHSGHIRRIQQAKKYGNYLIVHITPDNRIKRHKGKDRPILSQKERMFIVSHIKGVDRVVCVPEQPQWDTEDYEIECIKRVKPDVYICEKTAPKLTEFCKKNGVNLKILKETTGIDKKHTSDLIKML